MTERSNARVQRYFDAHAGGYDQQMGGAERWLLGGHRRWATSRAEGEVLELAVGTGLNLPMYDEKARRVVGVDVSEEMLQRASARVAEHRLGHRIAVRLGDAQRLDLLDASMDTVVATYALCTIPDPSAALAEAWRVLRPGGQLVLVEHGQCRSAAGRLVQRALNVFTLRWQSDDLLLQPRTLVAEAGFEITVAEQVGRAGLVHRVHARRPAVAT